MRQTRIEMWKCGNAETCGDLELELELDLELDIAWVQRENFAMRAAI